MNMYSNFRKSTAAFCCLWVVLFAGTLMGQQLRVSNFYLFNPHLINPGSVGMQELNNVNLSHQQRKTSVPGLRSFSDFLNFSSQPVGRKGRFGFGFNIMSDYEWTEFRIGVNGSVSVALIKTDNQRLSVGIMGGFITWGSNYKTVRVYDRTDLLINDRSNFFELDAGLGGEYRVHTKRLRGDLNAYAMQLPGNMISAGLQGLNIYPHVFVGGGLLFSPIHNIFIGPRVFYKNIVGKNDKTIFGAKTDVGLRLDLERQKMWFAGSLRPSKDAGMLNAAFGLRVKETDTIGDPTRYGYFVDINAGFSFPLAQTSVFGPTAEIGVNILMGRHNRLAFRNDTVRVSAGPFWQDEGNYNDHLQSKLKANGPQGLRGTTKKSDNTVVLTYTFDDNSYQYVGNTPKLEQDSLFAELGPEWIGVDALLENIIDHVIYEGLNPDTNNVVNPEVLEPLKDLVNIELSTSLVVDEVEANQPAKGMMYEGEMGVNNRYKDSLMIKVVYNEKDTVIGIGKDQSVTNLELAALKLHAMRKKLEYELNLRYGEEWAVLWDGEEPTEQRLGSKNKVVYLKTPRITPNNPKQPAFQVSTIKLKFTRGNTVVAAVEDDGRGKRRNEHRRRRPAAGSRIRDRVY
jgi:hypothetical protein